MALKSFAKINLTLNVNKKTKNGLHDIQSIYCLVNKFDTIYIKKNQDKNYDNISFTGTYSKYIDRSKNSVKAILDILRNNKLISNYYNIKINKRIPVFGGLGGGTSNAAIIFQHLIKKKIKKDLLQKISSKIGSDFFLFFHNQGFLKDLSTVTKFNKNYQLNFLLIYPKIKCSTMKIYSKVKRYSKKETVKIESLKSRKKFIDHIIKSNNDLQSIVEKEHPIISKLLLDIYKTKGCFLSRMSGSGSVCYGLFNNNRSSKAALKKLRKKYPKFSFSIAKTI